MTDKEKFFTNLMIDIHTCRWTGNMDRYGAYMAAIATFSYAHTNSNIGDEDGRDTLISFFNSSPAELHPIANNLITSIIAGDIKANLYTLHLPGDIIVDGQMYVTKKWSYIAFDFYVIRIRYPNGRVYEASRIKRPE